MAPLMLLLGTVDSWMLTCFCGEDRIQDDEEEEDIMQSDDGAHTWLEDLGLDKSHFRSLDPNKVKLYPLIPYLNSCIDTHDLYKSPIVCRKYTAYVYCCEIDLTLYIYLFYFAGFSGNMLSNEMA